MFGWLIALLVTAPPESESYVVVPANAPLELTAGGSTVVAAPDWSERHAVWRVVERLDEASNPGFVIEAPVHQRDDTHCERRDDGAGYPFRMVVRDRHLRALVPRDTVVSVGRSTVTLRAGLAVRQTDAGRWFVQHNGDRLTMRLAEAALGTSYRPSTPFPYPRFDRRVRSGNASIGKGATLVGRHGLYGQRLGRSGSHDRLQSGGPCLSVIYRVKRSLLDKGEPIPTLMGDVRLGLEASLTRPRSVVGMEIARVPAGTPFRVVGGMTGTLPDARVVQGRRVDDALCRKTTLSSDPRAGVIELCVSVPPRAAPYTDRVLSPS